MRGGGPRTQIYNDQRRGWVVHPDAGSVLQEEPFKNARTVGKYVAFITNIRVDNSRDLLRHIPKAYRKRWGIEVGYHVLEWARAKTKSPRTAARLFLVFFVSVRQLLAVIPKGADRECRAACRTADGRLHGHPLDVRYGPWQAPITCALQAGPWTPRAVPTRCCTIWRCDLHGKAQFGTVCRKYLSSQQGMPAGPAPMTA